MTHVFVSYAPVDHDFATYLFRQLNEAGISEVVDCEDARAWDNWHEETDRAIEEACALIVVMSPQARGSEYVTYEWAYALGIRKLVVAIVLEPTGLHPRLETIPVFDFTNGDPPWDDLIQTLQRAEIEFSANKLVEALQYHHWETRMVAAEILGGRGDPAVIPALSQSLEDSHLEVRVAAAEAMGKIGDPAAVPYLTESLFSSDIDVRTAAAWALGKISDPAAVPALVQVLRDGSTRIRWNAAWALGEIGAPAVPGLVEALRDEDGRVRGTAAGALAAIGVSDAVPGLVHALNDEDWTVREAAARALGQLQDAAAVHGLIGALHDDDDRVRGTAAGALAAIGAPALPALVGALHDPEQHVRLAVAGALGTMAYRKAAPNLLHVLTDILRDPDPDMRGIAAWALGELGGDVIPLLESALRDDAGSVRVAALKALRRMNTSEAWAAIEIWQRE